MYKLRKVFILIKPFGKIYNSSAKIGVTDRSQIDKIYDTHGLLPDLYDFSYVHTRSCIQTSLAVCGYDRFKTNQVYLIKISPYNMDITCKCLQVVVRFFSAQIPSTQNMLNFARNLQFKQI